jgi:hypothetical protein
MNRDSAGRRRVIDKAFPLAYLPAGFFWECQKAGAFSQSGAVFRRYF